MRRYAGRPFWRRAAAIAIGSNPDEAVNMAVVVPGTSHSVTEGWLSSDDAVHIYAENKNADHGKPVSVIAWMGYDASDSLAVLKWDKPGWPTRAEHCWPPTSTH